MPSLLCTWCPQLPIFPARRQASIFGVDELNFCVRHGNRWNLIAIITDFCITNCFAILLCYKFKLHLNLTSSNHQWSDAAQDLLLHSRSLTASKLNKNQNASLSLTCFRHNLWLSPRPISTRWLKTLLLLHLEPINLLVFQGSYSLRMGYLILRAASRLDAFSVYPFRT